MFREDEVQWHTPCDVVVPETPVRELAIKI